LRDQGNYNKITDLHRTIGAHVSSLIEDGSFLQCGIGGIPDAVLPNLIDRKNLGVHTKLLSDNAIPLIEACVINGQRKNFKPRKIILGFVLGSKQLFDFVDENPIFEFPSLGLHQRSVPHFAERADGGDQLGH
jgi:4-hydroxybutyrate CoA-transferase